jgi:hypothetical protein
VTTAVSDWMLLASASKQGDAMRLGSNADYGLVEVDCGRLLKVLLGVLVTVESLCFVAAAAADDADAGAASKEAP